MSFDDKVKEKEIFIYKGKEPYAVIENGNFKIYKNGIYELDKNGIYEILDILPEGIDLEIMMLKFNTKNPIDILPYLKNPIGNYNFSYSNIPQYSNHIVSNYNIVHTYPTILKQKLDISEELLIPTKYGKTYQQLSLSGYQHKIQVQIDDKSIKNAYSNYILKPNSKYTEHPFLAINEHLNTSFMHELGFEVPSNAVIYDEKLNKYHYIIKRFDIDSKGEKKNQISLNALMGSEDKFSGSLEQITKFLNNKLNENEKLKLLAYFYSNALLFNNDFHKKNISFFYENGQFKITPCYDVINIYPIKGLKDTQCILNINGRLNKIRLRDFEKSIQNFNLNSDKAFLMLNNIFEKYMEFYPIYIEKLDNFANFKNVKYFKTKLYESYNKCLKTFEISDKNFVSKLKENTLLKTINFKEDVSCFKLRRI